MSFFGGDTGITYEQLQARKKMVEQLRKSTQRTPRNVGEGIHSIARALVARGAAKQNKQHDADLRAKFEDAFKGVSPNTQGLIDLASSPYATKAHQGVISALMKGAPNYKRGTLDAPGGMAVVGEDGPEVVNLPRHAQVLPFNQPLPDGSSLDPADAEELYSLPPSDQKKAIERILNGETPRDVLQPPGFDPRSLIPREESNFQPGAEFQTAQSGEIDLPYGDTKLTGDQSKTVTYHRRAFGANEQLNDPKLEQALTQHTDTFAKNFGSVGRIFQDADFQVADRAAREFLAAILRKDTGAAITNEEFKLYGPMYLPEPGDKPELLAAKKKARAEALTAIEMGLGTAAPLAAQTRSELGQPKDLSNLSDEDLLKALGGGS